MAVPAVVPLLDTIGSPPFVDDVGVGDVAGLPPFQENALVGPFTWVQYTSCTPPGPVQSAGELNNDPTVPGGSSCWILSMVVLPTDPQLRPPGAAVNPPMLVVLTT